MNHGWSYIDRIEFQEVGKTVLEFYTKFQHSSQADWHRRIVAGHIELDGNRTTPETRLRLHQTLAYNRPPWVEPAVPLSFQILYEDADLWIVDKPAGLPILPGGQFLEHTLLGQLRCQYPHESLVPIHRLGRGTSGLVLLARSQRARQRLSQQMRHRRIFKLYRTLIGPGTYPDHFTLTHPIGKYPYPKLGYIYAATCTGRLAESHCQVLQRQAHKTLLNVNITTGRPHQIRIHLAAYGYPLIGDPLYMVGGIPYPPDRKKKQAIPSDCGYWLHAAQLKFLHPNQQDELDIKSPLPEVFQIQPI